IYLQRFPEFSDRDFILQSTEDIGLNGSRVIHESFESTRTKTFSWSAPEIGTLQLSWAQERASSPQKLRSRLEVLPNPNSLNNRSIQTLERGDFLVPASREFLLKDLSNRIRRVRASDWGYPLEHHVSGNPEMHKLPGNAFLPLKGCLSTAALVPLVKSMLQDK